MSTAADVLESPTIRKPAPHRPAKRAASPRAKHESRIRGDKTELLAERRGSEPYEYNGSASGPEAQKKSGKDADTRKIPLAPPVLPDASPADLPYVGSTKTEPLKEPNATCSKNPSDASSPDGKTTTTSDKEAQPEAEATSTQQESLQALEKLKEDLRKRVAQGCKKLDVFFSSALGQALDADVHPLSVRAYLLRFCDEAGSYQDPIEKKLLELMAMSHLLAARLHGRAATTTDAEFARLYLGAAARQQSEFCRATITLGAYRTGGRGGKSKKTKKQKGNLPIATEQEQGVTSVQKKKTSNQGEVENGYA